MNPAFLVYFILIYFILGREMHFRIIESLCTFQNLLLTSHRFSANDLTSLTQTFFIFKVNFKVLKKKKL